MSNGKLKNAVTEGCRRQIKDFFKPAIWKLTERWNVYIQEEGSSFKTMLPC